MKQLLFILLCGFVVESQAQLQTIRRGGSTGASAPSGTMVSSGSWSANDLVKASDTTGTNLVAAVAGTDYVSPTGTTTLSAKKISLNAGLGTDDTYEGIQITGLNNTGGVTQWDVVYLNSSSQWVLADANGVSTYPARGIATATVATGNATTVLVSGVIRNDAWNWTVGGTIYLSDTAGGLTQTAPSTTGDKVQVIGYALTADIMAVAISADYGTAP
jgi:hypothetical protein